MTAENNNKTSKLTKQAIEKFLAEGKRFDGRKPLDHREISIETGISENAEGSAKVKLGKTEVWAGVKLGLSEPYTDHPDEGTMMTTMELLPLSGSQYEYGRPTINSIEIARIVDRGIRESGFIDFKKLCIKSGEAVWTVFIDLYSINDDGDLLDACALAAVAALMTAKMPKYDEKEARVLYGEWEDKGLPLSKKIPLTMTLHKVGKKIIVDPNKEEEDASKARVSIALSNEKEILIHAMQRGEEAAFTEEEMDEIIDSAEKIFKDFNSKVLKLIK